jgi:hypothetical protein
MTGYKPEQREVPLRAVTTAGVVEGTLRVAKSHILLDAVNHGHEFMSLTDVHVRDAPQRIPFFALRRSETLLLVPTSAAEDPDDVAARRGSLVDHDVMCLLPTGSISGKLSILKDARVSDFLANQRAFFVLRECRAWLSATGFLDERPPVLLVNAARVVGVTELG